MDFALITLKTPVTEGTGYFGIQRGTGEANIDISSVRSPKNPPLGFAPARSFGHLMELLCITMMISCI